MAKNISNPILALQKRRHEVAILYLRGETQWDIATKIGVDQGQISRDLVAIRESWKQEDKDARYKELARIDVLEIEYLKAWERSCRPKERKSAKTTTAGTADHKEATIVTEMRDGNPKFLDGIMRCIERRCAILGIDAPKKVAETDPNGNPIDRSISSDRIRESLLLVFAASCNGQGSGGSQEATLSLADIVGESTGGEPSSGNGAITVEGDEPHSRFLAE